MNSTNARKLHLCETGPGNRWLAFTGSAITAALALLPLPCHADAKVYAESASVKVQPNTSPKDTSVARLSAAMNEFEAFQVVVHAEGGDVQGVTATAGALSGPDGASIPSSGLVLYREALMNVTQPSGTIGQTGTWPDGLIPSVDEIDGQQRNAFPFTVPAGESRAIWVDVLVPPNAKPGMYKGAIHVEGSGLSTDVPIELEVWGFQLPSTPSLATAFLAFSSNVCRAHTGQEECGSPDAEAAMMAKYERLALDHRLTLPNVMSLRNQGDDWSAFDAAYGPLLDGTAPTRLAGAKMTSAQYTWSRDTGTYAAFASHFHDKGWFDRLFDYTADEPPYGSQWGDIPRIAQQVKAADPSLKVLVTTNINDAQSNGVSDSIDLMVPIVNDMDGPSGGTFAGDQRPKYDAFLAPGKTLWMYQSCMSHGCSFGGGEPGTAWPSYMIDVPAMRNRLMQWADFKAGVTGELYYETAGAFSQDAWSSVYEFSGNGDGTLFYPGTPGQIGGSSDIPVASIRMKMIREGIEDFEYLTLVAKLGDPGFARQVAAEVLPNLYSTDQNDPAPLEAARQKLARRILELQGTAASSQGSDGSGCSATTTASSPVAMLSPGLLRGIAYRRRHG